MTIRTYSNEIWPVILMVDPRKSFQLTFTKCSHLSTLKREKEKKKEKVKGKTFPSFSRNCGSRFIISSLETMCGVIVQFNSAAQSCLTLRDPMNCSTPGLHAHHQLPESTQTHVHWVGDAIQPSHALSSPSPPALNPSQHQGLFKWVSFSHQVAKVLEFQLQHQSFQRIPRTDLL